MGGNGETNTKPGNTETHTKPNLSIWSAAKAYSHTPV